MWEGERGKVDVPVSAVEIVLVGFVTQFDHPAVCWWDLFVISR